MKSGNRNSGANSCRYYLADERTAKIKALSFEKGLFLLY